ncbi:hypothetical protein IFM89_014004 [Coptis chinensis]|uniref:Alpha-N-acetylglucosaminidase n=1 Tax=Coptis chinensis TaxID=261450 RepID=A0A835INR3_9MAGN|nr:hypothetical protein IFM89_014004 [Coptis chinensis]
MSGSLVEKVGALDIDEYRPVKEYFCSVLPSFSGNVLAAIKIVFPSANITRLKNWNTIDGDPRWCCSYFLDPSDPLFVEIGHAFIKQQMEVSHFIVSQVGVGMCMEGIEQNPVVFELMSEMAFRSEKVQLEANNPFLLQEWLKSYSYRRYGKKINLIEDAWEILHRTIYNCTDRISDHNKDFIVKFPDFDPSSYFQSNMSKDSHIGNLFSQGTTNRFSSRETTFVLPQHNQPHLWYSTEEVIVALQLFLDARNYLAGSLTYRYDLVDLTRQVLSKLANQVYADAMIAFYLKDANALSLQSQKFLQLIKDIDILLASDNNFLLGTWTESAKRLATNPTEKRQYEWNARTQLTMWYDNTKTKQNKLHDYANKFWSGLLEGYYLPRTSTYFDYLLTSVRRNESFKLEEWKTEWISFSNKWQSGTELYPVQAKATPLLFQKHCLRNTSVEILGT